jgi:hypothetical protein
VGKLFQKYVIRMACVRDDLLEAFNIIEIQAIACFTFCLHILSKMVPSDGIYSMHSEITDAVAAWIHKKTLRSPEKTGWQW